MMVANFQMGILNLGRNGVFLSNPPSESPLVHGWFPVPPRPNSRITFSSTAAKTKWGFDSGHPKSRITNALASGGMEARSSDLGFLEKELKFSPTFDDYVKVMESIRTDPVKNLSADAADECSSKKRSIGQDTSGAPDSKGKEKLVRLKRNSLKEKTNDREGREHKEKDGLSRGRRDRDLKEVRGVRKSSKHDAIERSSGWGLVEGILEKAIVGRSGDRGRGRSNSVGSNGGLSDGSSSCRKSNGVRGNVDDRHFMKKEVGSGSYLKSQKIRQVNRRDVKRDDEFRISAEPKDTWGHGSNGNFGERTRNGSVSHSRERKFNYVDNSPAGSGKGKWAHDRTDSVKGELGRSEFDQRKEKQGFGSKMEKKVGDYESSKSLLGRKSSVRSTVTKMPEESISAFEIDKFYGTSTGKKSNGSDIHKNKWNDGTYLRSDQRKAEGNLRSKTKILDMDTKQKARTNDMDGNSDGRGTLKTNGILDRCQKKILEQGTGRSHLRSHGDATETEKLASRTITTRGSSDKNYRLSDKVLGREIVVIDPDDRAAFRTFEDVRNRPRVLRMELEERIEKLAKWLNATDVNMPAWQFSKMMHSAQIKFTDHSILRVVQILGTLGNWKRALQVVEWLHSRDRFNSYKSRYIYTTVLDVLGKARRPIEALNIFYAMRQELSSYPDLAAYHCIAVILGQAGLMKELFDVIDCMRGAPKKKFNLGFLQKWDPRLEPDLVIYNAVLNACVQQKQWEGAFWVWQQLKQHGIKPSNTTYGLAMEVMLACGKYNLVHEFFRKVEKTSIPGALNYKVLINTLWREGKIDEAVLAVCDMERRGIVGSASLYYDLARCLCSAGRCQEALLQINKICKVAKKPLVVTYTGLIQACLDSGSIENAAYIFNQMRRFCSPNTVTCNIMLKSYLDHGRFEEAKELFNEILDGSHRIESKAALSQKVIPDKYTFNTMMEAYVAVNNWDGFEDAYRQMLHHGFHFDVKRHLRMILDAFRAGKGKVLEATWEHLIRSGRVPPPPIIKERFCMKLEEDDHLAAISCIGIHQKIELQAFSEKSWFSLVKSNADRLKKDTILRLACELSSRIEEGSQPHTVYANLLSACREFVSFTKTSINSPGDHRTLSCDLQLKC